MKRLGTAIAHDLLSCRQINTVRLTAQPDGGPVSRLPLAARGRAGFFVPQSSDREKGRTAFEFETNRQRQGKAPAAETKPVPRPHPPLHRTDRRVFAEKKQPGGGPRAGRRPRRGPCIREGRRRQGGREPGEEESAAGEDGREPLLWRTGRRRRAAGSVAGVSGRRRRRAYLSRRPQSRRRETESPAGREELAGEG